MTSSYNNGPDRGSRGLDNFNGNGGGKNWNSKFDSRPPPNDDYIPPRTSGVGMNKGWRN